MLIQYTYSDPPYLNLSITHEAYYREFQSYTSLSITVGLFHFVEGKRPITIKLNLQEIGFGGTCTVLFRLRTGTSGGLC
jgi:hypothetical protein